MLQRFFSGRSVFFGRTVRMDRFMSDRLGCGWKRIGRMGRQDGLEEGMGVNGEWCWRLNR